MIAHPGAFRRCELRGFFAELARVFLLVGPIAGGVLGGALPGVGDFLLSLQLVTMVVLGGIGSIYGAIVGAGVLVMLPQVLTALHDYEHAFLGFVLITCMIFLRAGIVPTLASALRRRG